MRLKLESRAGGGNVREGSNQAGKPAAGGKRVPQGGPAYRARRGVRRGKGEGLHEARRKEEIGMDLERRRKKKNDRVGRVPTSFRPAQPVESGTSA